MKVLTSAPPGSPEWLAHRKGKIGGNMAADILGCGRKTPLQAWAELTGKIEPEDISAKPYVRRGNLLEPVILKAFGEDSGYALEPSPGMLQHPTHAFLAGTPDALYRRPDGDRGVVDAKAVGFYRTAEWKLGVPLRVQVQTAFYALLLGPVVTWQAAAAMPIDEDEDEAAVLWDEQALSPGLLEALETRLVIFWEHNVLGDVPPDWDPHRDRATLKAMFPRDSGEEFEMSPGMLSRWQRIEELRAQIGQATKEKDVLTGEIEAEFAERTWAVGPDFRLRYQLERREAYEVKPWEGRVLRRMKRGG
jgi:predicted phage-related endonuclease